MTTPSSRKSNTPSKSSSRPATASHKSDSKSRLFAKAPFAASSSSKKTQLEKELTPLASPEEINKLSALPDTELEHVFCKHFCNIQPEEKASFAARMQFDIYKRSTKEARLTVLKEMRKPKIRSEEVESMIARFQQDLQRRRESQKTREKLLSQNAPAQRAREDKKITKAESDKFYERLMNAKRMTEEVVNAKRKMVRQIREEQEMKEVKKTPVKSPAEVKKLLKRFELDTARRQTEAQRLAVIKNFLQEANEEHGSRMMYKYRSTSTSRPRSSCGKRVDTGNYTTQSKKRRQDEEENGFAAAAEEAMKYSEGMLMTDENYTKTKSEDRTEGGRLKEMIQEALKEEVDYEGICMEKQKPLQQKKLQESKSAKQINVIVDANKKMQKHQRTPSMGVNQKLKKEGASTAKSMRKGYV